MTQPTTAEPKPCRECGNVSYHQRDCSMSNWEDTGNDAIVRNEDREDDESDAPIVLTPAQQGSRKQTMTQPIPETDLVTAHDFRPMPQNPNWCAYFGCTGDKAAHGQPETDLVKIAEQEVIEAAREWAALWGKREGFNAGAVLTANDELLAAVTLLTAREGMAATTHLDDERGRQ